MEGLSDLGNTRPRSDPVVHAQIDQMLAELTRPAEEHASRPRSNSVVNREIEQMIAELQTRDEEHRARMAEIRHNMPFFHADADLFRRAGILGSRGASRLHSMSRNAAPTHELTPAGKRFMEQLPVTDENDFQDETSCSICMDPYGSTDDPESRARLPCGHLMGRSCIERWLETCNTCPLCRHVLFEQDDAESPAFLELQGLLQRLGPGVTRLFVRMMDHVRSSGTSVETEPSQAGTTPGVGPEEGVPSIEDAIDSMGPSSSFETGTPQTVMTPDEEAVPSTEDDIDSIWREIDELGRQQAALEMRMADYDADAANGPLGSERQMVVAQLIADNEELAVRLEVFRLRRQEMIESYGFPLSRVG